MSSDFTLMEPAELVEMVMNKTMDYRDPANQIKRT